MGFRDETEALRHQKHRLDAEVRALDDERARLRAEVADAARSIDERVAAGVAGAGVGPAIGLGALAGVIGLVAFLPGDPGGNTTLFGQARAVTGDAPVGVGAPCTAVLDFLDQEDDSTTSRLEVICAGRTIYGGGEAGYLACEYDDDEVVVRCSDTDVSSDGGDPRLALDRAARTLVLEDRSPTWRMEIALTVVPGREGS